MEYQLLQQFWYSWLAVLALARVLCARGEGTGLRQNRLGSTALRCGETAADVVVCMCSSRETLECGILPDQGAALRRYHYIPLPYY